MVKHLLSMVVAQRSYWTCSCGHWVCYITQPRKGGTGGKPDRQGAEYLHRRHIEDTEQPEEEWW